MNRFHWSAVVLLAVTVCIQPEGESQNRTETVRDSPRGGPSEGRESPSSQRDVREGPTRGENRRSGVPQGVLRKPQSVVNTLPPQLDGELYASCRSVSFTDLVQDVGPENEALCCDAGQTVVYGSGLEDVIIEPAEGVCVFADGSGDFVITGVNDDTIFGQGGGDIIVTHGGDDIIAGISGDDIVLAGAGDDEVWGGSGADTLYGGPGRDVVFGEAGVDQIDGGSGPDAISGGDGDDLILGGGGSDALYGGAGDDLIEGGEGADELFPEGGADDVRGGDGDDRFVLRHACDITEGLRLDGGDGEDTVVSQFSREELVAAGVDLVDIENMQIVPGYCDPSCPQSDCQTPTALDWAELCHLACRRAGHCAQGLIMALGGEAFDESVCDQRCPDVNAPDPGQLLDPSIIANRCPLQTPTSLYAAQVSCLLDSCGETLNCEVNCE